MVHKIEFEPVRSDDVVTDRHFGTNYLANRQSHDHTIEGDGAFDEATDWIGVSNFRYPGGTIAEKYFDITDARHFETGATDAIEAVNFTDSGDVTQFTRLGTFLDYAASEGGKVTVVVPTVRFFETIASGDPGAIASLEGEVKAFVRNAMEHRSGGVISGFEIGNEFASWIDGHNGSLMGSSADFAALLRNMTVWINEELDSLNLMETPDIIAQAAFVKYGYKGNNPLLNNLFNEDLDQDYPGVESVADFFEAVDAVTAHYYPFRPWLDRADGTQSIADDADLIDDWQARFDDYALSHGLTLRELGSYATEWNIRNAAFKDGEVAGAKAGIASVALFHRLVAEGVDEMQVWPVLQGTQSRLIDAQNDDVEMEFTGAAFTLLRDLATGLAVDEGGNAADSDGDGKEDVFFYNFAMDGRVCTFISAKYETSITLDYAGFGLDADRTSVHVARLGSSAENALDPDGTPRFEMDATRTLFDTATEISVDLQPWEMVVIYFDEGLSAVEGVESWPATFDFASAADYVDRIPPGLPIVQTETGNVMRGDDGNSTFQVFPGFVFDGAGGMDVIAGTSAADAALGGAGNDRLSMADGDDFASGEAGNDVLFGGAGDDYLMGGSGDDVVDGGSHEDWLSGGGGNDVLRGGNGFDLLSGDAGADRLLGGAHADNLHGGSGDDALYGGQGFDRLFGGAGDDALAGGTEGDALFAESGDDTLAGDAGDDRLFAGAGNDLLRGGLGNDNLVGNAGFDTLDGGAGNDRLVGGFNADIFVFKGDFGEDVIVDFDALNPFEKIDLSGAGTASDFGMLRDNHMAQVASDVIIDTGEGNRIILRNVDLNDLDESDFLL